MYTRPLMIRFYLKVKFVGDCWVWSGHLNNRGYGQFRPVTPGKLWLAHRFSYHHFKGVIPKEKCVLHACDNPACVNPGHLSIGTQMDNVVDMIEKGRQQDYSSVRGNQFWKRRKNARRS